MTDPGADGRLNPDDLRTLAAIGRGNAWLRAVLCTLARRGVQLREHEPDRAAAIVDAVSTWPIYRGGQFLFDLMEWEDFMIDGPLPDPVDTVLDSRALARLAQTLKALQAHLDGDAESSASAAAPPPTAPPVAGVATGPLPALEPGFHLYRDVALGALVSVGPLLTASATADEG